MHTQNGTRSPLPLALFALASLGASPGASAQQEPSGVGAAGIAERTPDGWRYDAALVDRVEIALPSGVVSVAPAREASVTVRLAESTGASSCRTRLLVEDRVLRVDAGGTVGRCTADLALSLPASVSARLSIDAGTVLLDGPSSAVTVEGRAVHVTGTAKGTVEVDTGTGNIVLRGLVRAPIATSERGRVVLKFDEVPSGPIVARSGIDRLHVALPHGATAEVVGEVEPPPRSGGDGGPVIETTR